MILLAGSELHFGTPVTFLHCNIWIQVKRNDAAYYSLILYVLRVTQAFGDVPKTCNYLCINSLFGLTTYILYRLQTAQTIRQEDWVSYQCSSYLKLIDSDPTIWWKSLEHRHQELETAGPVADQEHHADKVEYAHEHARHVQELKKRESLYPHSSQGNQIFKNGRFQARKGFPGSSGCGCNIKRANKSKMNLWRRLSFRKEFKIRPDIKGNF